MGQRSRKRGRRERPAASVGVTTKPPRAAKASVPAHTPGGAKAPSRSEERNAAVRAALTPLAPGERPWPILVSVAIATVLSVVNLGLFIGGAKPHVGGQQPHLGEILVFSGLMLMCAAGMWWMRYWAVLGFQTLLAIGLLTSERCQASLCVAVRSKPGTGRRREVPPVQTITLSATSGGALSLSTVCGSTNRAVPDRSWIATPAPSRSSRSNECRRTSSVT